jgi:hypothetical protein
MVGATKEGHNIDGVLPEELRRSGEFHWPPEPTNYAWGGLQGAAAHAEILHRAGYPAWEWGDEAIRRAVVWLYDEVGWDAIDFGDEWTVHLVNARTGTNYALQPDAQPGKNMGFTQWTHMNVQPPEAENRAPYVFAGADQTTGMTATLDGTVRDDGLPDPPGLVTTAWSLVDGPGTVTFADASAADTMAAFSAAGVYTLRLTASDGVLSSSDEVTITVAQNQAPVVDAGPDQTIMFNKNKMEASTSLSGTVTDDGLPDSGSLTTLWTLVSGPGTVTFADASSLSTKAIFKAPGDYLLRLEAFDGELTGSDEVLITVRPHGGPKR